MKIAIITSGFLPVVDGVTVTGFSRVQKLSKLGHEVLLFCPDYSSLESIYPNWRDYTGEILPRVRVVNLPSTPFMGVDFERNVSPNSYGILLKELQEFQPEIIHVDEPERLFVGFQRIPGVAFAKRNNIPCIAFFRTNFIEYLDDFFSLPRLVSKALKWFLKNLFCYIYNAYDVTLTTSKITHKKLIQMGIKNTKYGNLLGLEMSQFNLTAPAKNFFAKTYEISGIEQKVKLIFIGRLTPDKGWNFTLKAFSRVAEIINLEQIALIIVGGGEMSAEIVQELSKLTPHTYLLGRISPAEIPQLLANSDLHITTSEKETRGLTILEAFAAGIPVLAPDAGGVVENIVSGENGLLYTPQDQEDFAQKLKLLAENPSLRKEMGEKGKDCVKDYDWEQIVNNLVDIWQEELEKQLSY